MKFENNDDVTPEIKILLFPCLILNDVDIWL